jgi:hypothetical protein
VQVQQLPNEPLELPEGSVYTIHPLSWQSPSQSDALIQVTDIPARALAGTRVNVASTKAYSQNLFISASSPWKYLFVWILRPPTKLCQ